MHIHLIHLQSKECALVAHMDRRSHSLKSTIKYSHQIMKWKAERKEWPTTATAARCSSRSKRLARGQRIIRIIVIIVFAVLWTKRTRTANNERKRNVNKYFSDVYFFRSFHKTKICIIERFSSGSLFNFEMIAYARCMSLGVLVCHTTLAACRSLCSIHRSLCLCWSNCARAAYNHRCF